MMIGDDNHVWLYIGLSGIGIRIRGDWWRLKPNSDPMTYSERYGDRVIWRGLGLRLTCLRSA